MQERLQSRKAWVGFAACWAVCMLWQEWVGVRIRLLWGWLDRRPGFRLPRWLLRRLWIRRYFRCRRLKRGQRGVAYTVFEGVTPEPMEVEILGGFEGLHWAGQDMILARLHGTKPEYTGVVAGMSGSPVYIDGRLVGALSYRIGQFSKEPICGITPIELMLAVRDGDRREWGCFRGERRSRSRIFRPRCGMTKKCPATG